MYNLIITPHKDDGFFWLLDNLREIYRRKTDKEENIQNVYFGCFLSTRLKEDMFSK